jgi:hypothetical protein
VAAAAVSAADVAACSSGEGPQADNKMQNSIKANPRMNLLDKNIISLLLLLSGLYELIRMKFTWERNKKTMPLSLALFSGVKQRNVWRMIILNQNA